MELKEFTTYITKFNGDSLLVSATFDKYNSHPVIIFYDDYSNQVYFIAGRSTYKGNVKKYIKDTEVEISPTKKGMFINHNTYFDYSTIYRMDKDEFEEFFEDNKVEDIKKYYSLSHGQINKLLNAMYKEFSSKDPSLRVIECKYQDKKVKHKGDFVTINYLRKNLKGLDKDNLKTVLEKYQKRFKITKNTSTILGMISNQINEYNYFEKP